MSCKLLLVHGAAHGSWCWARVAPRLIEAGYSVHAMDLPGRENPGLSAWRWSLDDYVTAVIETAMQSREPVIAVGHSMAGMVISAAAERAPEIFHRLIYLSAFLPRHGDSMVSLGAEDQTSQLAEATSVSWLRGIVSIVPASAWPVFYGDCSEDDVRLALSRIRPEPIRPSLARANLSENRFGTVARSYIRCLQDRALSIGMQDQMVTRQPCDRVATLDASHSPFLSVPDRLAEAILDVIPR